MTTSGIGQLAADLKFQQLAIELRRNILAGTWSVGAKLPTEQQLAQQTGLSLTTIRRAFDELVNQGLVVRRRGAGSFVAERSAPARGERWRIGVLIPSTQLYYGRVLQGIEDHLSGVGASLQLATYNYQPDREDAAIDHLVDAGVDGLILVPTLNPGPDALARVEQLAGLQVPVVLIERSLHDFGPRDRTEHVVSDHAGGAYDATEHLWRLGHRDIAVLLRAQFSTARGVRRGYEAAARDLGFAARTYVIPRPEWSPSRADELVAELTDQGVTAAIVFGDPEASLLESAARRAGRTVPGDLALVSYDDVLAHLAPVPLTAVSPAKHRAGRLAAEILIRRLEEGDACPLHQLRLRPRLIVRESCGAASATYGPHRP